MPSNGGFYDDRDTRILVEDVASIDAATIGEEHERSSSSSSGHCHYDEVSIEEGAVFTKVSKFSRKKEEKSPWSIAYSFRSRGSCNLSLSRSSLFLDHWPNRVRIFVLTGINETRSCLSRGGYEENLPVLVKVM